MGYQNEERKIAMKIESKMMAWLSGLCRRCCSGSLRVAR